MKTYEDIGGRIVVERNVEVGIGVAARLALDIVDDDEITVVGLPGLLVELKDTVVDIGSLAGLIMTLADVGSPSPLVVLTTVGDDVISVPGSDMAAQTMSHCFHPGKIRI